MHLALFLGDRKHVAVPIFVPREREAEEKERDTHARETHIQMCAKEIWHMKRRNNSIFSVESCEDARKACSL